MLSINISYEHSMYISHINVWLCYSSIDAGTLWNAEHPFISIAPRSTVALSMG